MLFKYETNKGMIKLFDFATLLLNLSMFLNNLNCQSGEN